ncbi:MAG: DNA mismatch repair protein MutS2, partial [Bradymonadia bacterium]
MDTNTEQHGDAERCFRAVLASALSGDGHAGLADKTFNDLGWIRIREQIALRCVGEDAAALAAELGVLPGRYIPRRRQQEVAEAMALLARGDSPPLRGIKPIGRALVLAEKGLVLGGEDLVAVGKTASATHAVGQYMRGAAAAAPYLSAHSSGLTDVREVAAEIGRCFDPSGDLTDDASKELGSLRRRAKRLREGLLRRLDQIVKSPQFEGILQDDYVTIREERYVLPVRSGERGDFPGIVHGTSSSGATLFIEPRELIESNNQFRIATLDVQAEERRILAQLSRLVGRHAGALEANQDVLTYLDLTVASARLSRELQSQPVTLTSPSDESPIRLSRARHPVLALRELAGELKVVPNDIVMRGAASVLVISGPNTGGKTVTLKTLGMFALMARAGLPLPCSEGSAFPLFDAVYSDIGDDQTVEHDLSTFSGHVENIASFYDDVDEGSLVLLDELFAGTDPEQGAALGRALLTRLAKRGATVVLTTHLESLKTLSYEDEQFVAASVAFDVESLAPTYQLRVGVPGSSYALRIAQRLGLASEVVSDAEELLAGTASLDRESLIERLEVEFQRVAEEREELAETREELARRSAKFEEKRQRMIDRDRKMVDKEAGKLKAELDGVRSQLRRIAREVRDFEGPSSASELGDKRRAVDQLRAELADAERAVSSARSVVSPDTNDELPTLTEEDFVVGTRVYVPSFKRSGEIVEVARGRAVVQVGPM